MSEVEETLAAQDQNASAEGAQAGQEGQEGAQAGEPGQEGQQKEGEETLLGGKSKGEEEGKGAGEAPESYDIKPPEGMELDQEMMTAFTPVFKEIGLTNEQAQKLADAYAPIIKQRTEAINQQSLKGYEGIVDGWKQETLKELGTDHKNALSLAAKARDKFGDEKLVEMFNETGVGNHPSMVKFLINVGKAISEDSFPDGATASGGDPLKAMYPSMKK